MKKLAALTLSMFLVSGTAFADTPKDSDAQPAKGAQPAKPKAAKKAENSNAAIAAQLEELRQTMQSQQEQLQMLKEELAKRDRQIDEAREAAAAANARAADASPKATDAVNTPAKVNMYYEGDFLGAGVTSNNRQSNSYVFRQRQLWVNAKFDSGFYVSAGQMWSLVTESKKGIENRQEAFPLMVDPQYIVGWAWQRAYQFRVAQNWDKFAVGFSIEGPQTTI